jgi:hypothetical protein
LKRREIKADSRTLNGADEYFKYFTFSSAYEKQRRTRRIRGSVPKGSFSKAAVAWADEAYRGVCEHGQAATCLREAAPAKAGNAAGGPFGLTQGMFFQRSLKLL